MNETDTFHIPNPEDVKSDERTEWDTLAEEFSDDDFMKRTQEIASRNTFDAYEQPTEKSEAELEYEKKEQYLIAELESISRKRANYLFNAGDEYTHILKSFRSPEEKRVTESMDELAAISENYSRRTLESLVELVNSRYPSPFETKKESLPNPFEDESNEDYKIEEAEDEYRRSVLTQGGLTSDTLENLSKAFTINGDQNDLYVGNSIKTLGNGRADVDISFANALISYLDDPSERGRHNLRRIEGDRENLTTGTLFNIASAFDESKSLIGGKLFEPTIALATNLVRNDEDYFDNLMKYLNFKIENAENSPYLGSDTGEERASDIQEPPGTPPEEPKSSLMPDLILR